jgi:hypothetical protein
MARIEMTTEEAFNIVIRNAKTFHALNARTLVAVEQDEFGHIPTTKELQQQFNEAVCIVENYKNNLRRKND